MVDPLFSSFDRSIWLFCLPFELHLLMCLLVGWALPEASGATLSHPCQVSGSLFRGVPQPENLPSTLSFSAMADVSKRRPTSWGGRTTKAKHPTSTHQIQKQQRRRTLLPRLFAKAGKCASAAPVRPPWRRTVATSTARTSSERRGWISSVPCPRKAAIDTSPR